MVRAEPGRGADMAIYMRIAQAQMSDGRVQLRCRRGSSTRSSPPGYSQVLNRTSGTPRQRLQQRCTEEHSTMRRNTPAYARAKECSTVLSCVSTRRVIEYSRMRGTPGYSSAGTLSTDVSVIPGRFVCFHTENALQSHSAKTKGPPKRNPPTRSARGRTSNVAAISGLACDATHEVRLSGRERCIRSAS